jgi:hypothetical protein
MSSYIITHWNCHPRATDRLLTHAGETALRAGIVRDFAYFL